MTTSIKECPSLYQPLNSRTIEAQPLTQEVEHNGNIICLALDRIPYGRKIIAATAALVGTVALAYLTSPIIRAGIDWSLQSGGGNQDGPHFGPSSDESSNNGNLVPDARVGRGLGIKFNRTYNANERPDDTLLRYGRAAT
jgi:hypothetical protein